MRNEVERTLGKVREQIHKDGGDVELVDVDETSGVVKVRLLGACKGCPMATLTLQMSIGRALKKEVPGVKKVMAVE